MKRRLTFAYPGNLDLRTGGYGYDREIIKGLKSLGWEVDLLELGHGFPFPAPQVLEDAERQLSTLAAGALVLIDGLAFGMMDAWASREGGRLRIVALVHHPLALETGLSLMQQAAFRRSETAALAAARQVIVTSPMTAEELARNFGVPGHKIAVAVPGTERPATRQRPENQTPQILSVGSLTARKGHDILIAALAKLDDLSWQATIIGSRHMDETVAGALAEQIRVLGLGDRITLAGEVEDLEPAYSTADIFALASRYEGYGMVFAEALAHGLPIVACRAGAVPDVVPDDAGILVGVDDVEAMAAALRRLLIDREERRRRAAAASRAGSLLTTWGETSRIIAATLDELR